MLARDEPRLDRYQHADQQHTLHRDYETRGLLRLASVGVHQYVSDAGTSVLCAAYAVDDDPVQLWTPGDPVPHEFVEAAHNPAWLVCAHNDGFETAVEQHILGRWPQIPIERHRCTMAMALAAGLPARLGALADALELANRKDAGGERLMHQMSKPRRPHKDENPAGTYWFEDQERVERLRAYCAQDVEVERELYWRLPPLSSSEQALWALNHTINTRGFHVDRAQPRWQSRCQCHSLGASGGERLMHASARLFTLPAKRSSAPVKARSAAAHWFPRKCRLAER
jgi:DNA polymerase